MEMRSNWKRVVLVAAATVCSGVAALPAQALVTLRVSTNDAIPGGDMTLQLGMTSSEAEEPVASAQLDVIFETSQLQLAGTCAGSGVSCQQNDECGEGGHCVLDCVKDPRLAQQDFNATFPEFQNLPTGQMKVRLRVLAPISGTLPLPSFSDGPIATCSFSVPAGAALGTVNLSANRVEVGDDEGDVLESAVEIIPGSIVDALPTETPTVTQTETPTETATPADTETPTATPEDTATPVATSTPQRTNTPVPPTSTPVQTTVPTNTNTVRPDPTPTLPPATATAQSTNTAVPPTPKGKDNDGCNIGETGEGNGLAWLGLPLAMVLVRRRRAS